MSNYKYIRDLSDGTRLQFDMPLAATPKDRYYDDFLALKADDLLSENLFVDFFGKEASYPDRTLNRIVNRYILHYVTDGCGTVNGQRVKKGQGFLLRPGEPSIIAADRSDPWHFKWISFGGREAFRILKSIGLDSHNYIFDFDFGDKIDALADEVLYSAHEDRDMSIYLRGLFYIIISYHSREGAASTVSERGNRYVSEAVEYIDTHYGEDIKIDALADELHISRKYLCAVFGKQMGMSTKEYLLMRRTNAAAALLMDTDMSVSEIATAVGYGDYTQLSRLFREKKGMSPQQYRKMSARQVDERNFRAAEVGDFKA